MTSDNEENNSASWDQLWMRYIVIAVVVVLLVAALGVVLESFTIDRQPPCGVPRFGYNVAEQNGTANDSLKIVKEGGKSMPANRIFVEINGKNTTWAELKSNTTSGDVHGGQSVSVTYSNIESIHIYVDMTSVTHCSSGNHTAWIDSSDLYSPPSPTVGSSATQSNSTVSAARSNTA